MGKGKVKENPDCRGIFDDGLRRRKEGGRADIFSPFTFTTLNGNISDDS